MCTVGEFQDSRHVLYAWDFSEIFENPKKTPLTEVGEDAALEDTLKRIFKDTCRSLNKYYLLNSGRATDAAVADGSQWRGASKAAQMQLLRRCLKRVRS